MAMRLLLLLSLLMVSQSVSIPQTHRRAHLFRNHLMNMTSTHRDQVCLRHCSHAADKDACIAGCNTRRNEEDPTEEGQADTSKLTECATTCSEKFQNKEQVSLCTEMCAGSDGCPSKALCRASYSPDEEYMTQAEWNAVCDFSCGDAPIDTQALYDECMEEVEDYKDSKTFKDYYEYNSAMCKCMVAFKPEEECEEEVQKSMVCATFPWYESSSTSSRQKNSLVLRRRNVHSMANEDERSKYMCAYGSKEVTGLTFDGSKGSDGVAVQYAKTNFIKCTFKNIPSTALSFEGYMMEEDDNAHTKTPVVAGFLGLDGCTFTDCGTSTNGASLSLSQRQANEASYGAVGVFGQFMILNCEFKNCGNADSCALSFTAIGDSSIGNTKFIDCTAYEGAVLGTANNCTLTITHCHFKNCKAQSAPAALEATLLISKEEKISSYLKLSNIAFEGSALLESERRNADEGIDAKVSNARGEAIPEGAVTISSVFTDKEEGVSVTVGGQQTKEVKKSENPAESADVDGSSGLSLPKLSEGGDDDDKFPTWAIIVIVVGAVVIIAVVVAIIVVCVMRKKGGAKVSPDENGDKTFSSGTTSTPPAESTEEENTETQ